MIAEWFQSLSERDRKLAVVGAVALALLVVFAVLVPLDRSVVRAHQRLAQKQSDLSWMRSVAPQLAAAGPQQVVTGNTQSLIAMVSRSATEAGLGAALVNTDASPDGGLRVRLDKASFDTVVGWLARLEQQNGIHVESANIDSGGAPGLVNAGIVLRGRR